MNFLYLDINIVFCVLKYQVLSQHNKYQSLQNVKFKGQTKSKYKKKILKYHTNYN